MRTPFLLLLIGCGDPSDGDTSAPGSDIPWLAAGGGTVDIVTRDGLTLVADYYPAEQEGRPTVVLLHMNPVYFDRSDWPPDFIERLHAHDWTVVVPDRRGAGESEGEAEDAVMGDAGRYDVEAAVLLATEDGYGDPLIIGASNGTTSMIDYAVWAEGEGLPPPVGLGFMTGGVYTENQTSMEEVVALGLPAIFTYSAAERGWSVDQQDRGVSDWSFLEYPEGDHGVKMFDAAPEVADDLDAWALPILGD